MVPDIQMDLGVGSFVYSQGIVSVNAHRKPWSVVLTRTGPMLALGLVRLLMVKGTDYPEHVSEYGVHWNFFLTMCVVQLCTDLLQRLGPKKVDWILVGLLVSLGHQVALSFSPLGAWTISEKRDPTSWVSMNKEGIVSLPGTHTISH